MQVNERKLHVDVLVNTVVTVMNSYVARRRFCSSFFGRAYNYSKYLLKAMTLLD